jgi:hypothetical protein
MQRLCLYMIRNRISNPSAADNYATPMTLLHWEPLSGWMRNHLGGVADFDDSRKVILLIAATGATGLPRV